MIIVTGWYRKRPGKQIREVKCNSTGISRLACCISIPVGLGPMQVTMQFEHNDENLRISIDPERAEEIGQALIAQARKARATNVQEHCLESMTNPGHRFGL